MIYTSANLPLKWNILWYYCLST